MKPCRWCGAEIYNELAECDKCHNIQMVVSSYPELVACMLKHLTLDSADGLDSDIERVIREINSDGGKVIGVIRCHS